MNAVALGMEQLLWASLQGGMLGAAVVMLCRWRHIAIGGKGALCRLAWVKMAIGPWLGAGFVWTFSTTIPAKGESGTQGNYTNALVGYLAALWIIGVAIEATLLVRRSLEARRLRRRAIAPDIGLLAKVQSVAKRASIRNLPELGLLPGLEEPCVLGGRRPMLLLPLNFRPEADPLAVLHELAHLRNHDLFWSGVCAWVQMFYWFLPGMGRLYRETMLWQEARADEFARRALTASPAEMARRVLTAVSARPTLGLSFGAAETERRILALLDRRDSRLALTAGALLALVLCIPMRIQAADSMDTVPLRVRVEGLPPTDSGVARAAAPVTL